VCGFGAALSGQQTGQPSRRQRRLRLVEGRPRHPEVCCYRADHLAVHLVAANHLVAHLDQIGRIKERIVSEQRITNGFGMGIERAVASQRFPLTIRGRCLGHCRPVVCNDKYAALYMVSSVDIKNSVKSLPLGLNLPRGAASSALQIRRNSLYTSPSPWPDRRTSSRRHRSSRSAVRNAARPAAIRRNSSSWQRSVNAREIDCCRPLSFR
jgi:hypothetical protein